MVSPFAFLAQLAIQAPMLLVWLVGMALALLWWQRAPKVALVTCVACGVFFLDALHLFFDELQIFRCDRAIDIDIVIEAVVECRANAKLGLWECTLDCGGHNMGR